MNRKFWVGPLVLLLASTGAFASDELSYNYVDVRYIDAEIDNGPEGDGLGVAGSVEVGERFHVLANYADLSFDPLFGIEIDTTTWAVGFGYHTDIGSRASFFGELSYVDVDLDSNIVNAGDDGYSATIGIRGMVARRLELVGAISYVDLSDSGDDTSVGAGLLYNISDAVSIGVGYSTSDDADELDAGVRFYWGKS